MIEELRWVWLILRPQKLRGIQDQGVPGLQSKLSFEMCVRIIIVITIKARVWFRGRAVDSTCLKFHGPSEALPQEGRKERMREEREKEEKIRNERGRKRRHSDSWGRHIFLYLPEFSRRLVVSSVQFKTGSVLKVASACHWPGPLGKAFSACLQNCLGSMLSPQTFLPIKEKSLLLVTSPVKISLIASWCSGLCIFFCF